MDVLSKRGQEFTRIQREVVKEYQVHNPSVVMVETPNNQPAAVDYIVVDPDYNLKGLVEVKVRKSGITTDEFEFGKYAIFDYEKLLDGCDLARLLRVPFYIWMFLLDSGNLYSWKITDLNGIVQENYKELNVTAKKNINTDATRTLRRFALGHSRCKRILEGFKID